jgi:Ca2+/H+ antiporter
MEALIPIFRLLHFLGLSLLLGGISASFALVKKEGPTTASIKLAHTCVHMLAAPGLVILVITGILQSSLLYWTPFKGAGYMHAKIVFIVLIFVLMIFDIRTQKKILTSPLKHDALTQMIKRRQSLAISMGALVLLIVWLMNFRPF